MDPLSITASIITVLQTTSQVLSICYDYAAAAKGSSWGLSRVIEELKSLRNVLESLQQLSDDAQGTDPLARSRLPRLRALSDPDHGPLASCRKELNHLTEKLRPPSWAAGDGTRRKAFVQSLSWPLKEGDTKKILQDIERFKGTLNLTMNADHIILTQKMQEGQEQGFQSLNQTLSSSRDDQRYQNILRWLSAPDPSSNYNSALKKRHIDTGLWFINSQQFRDWKVGKDAFLWLYGIPGCGKLWMRSCPKPTKTIQ